MRDIKFKGQMTTGQWVYGLPHLDIKGSTAYWNECSYRICWNPETGGQSNAPIKNGTLAEFIGITDKNGIDIYEKDWVRACFRDKEGYHYKQGEIVMNEYMWCLEATDGEIYSVNRLHDFEVLGNKQDNPELWGAS